jgi:hypothetical protein
MSEQPNRDVFLRRVLGGAWEDYYLNEGLTLLGFKSANAGHFYESFSDITRWTLDTTGATTPGTVTADNTRQGGVFDFAASPPASSFGVLLTRATLILPADDWYTSVRWKPAADTPAPFRPTCVFGPTNTQGVGVYRAPTGSANYWLQTYDGATFATADTGIPIGSGFEDVELWKLGGTVTVRRGADRFDKAVSTGFPMSIVPQQLTIGFNLESAVAPVHTYVDDALGLFKNAT